MMARPETKIELAPGPGFWLMMFEDISHGHMRTIYMNRGHKDKAEPTWMGDSIGKWEGDTLVVDTTGFSERVWLNESGAQHSEKLHMVERIRPVSGGQLLEYSVTAEDSSVLLKPYTYVRYYQKLSTEAMEDVCEADAP
jgi:hypothetical protein